MTSSMAVQTSALTTKLMSKGTTRLRMRFSRKFLTGYSRSTHATAPNPYTMKG